MGIWLLYCTLCHRLFKHPLYVVDSVALWSFVGMVVLSMLSLAVLFIGGALPLWWPVVVGCTVEVATKSAVIGMFMWGAASMGFFVLMQPYSFAYRVWGPTAVGLPAE